jgi:hypothetical protein
MVADYPLPIRAHPHRNVRVRHDRKEDLMSVKSVLHKIVDEMNRPHLHEEIDAPETETAEKAPEEEADNADQA